MIPILYEKTETAFISNGLGRLRDCMSALVVEERNGIFELDFEYPVSGANYELIQAGRIVAVTHDDTGDVQPFDIVSFSKPINGIVSFHCVHISYRQSYLTVTGSNINSLSDAFALLGTAEPTNPFTYTTDKTSSGYLAAADGIPRSVRSMLGGVEGSILDAYGGEYEWDKFNVILHSARGTFRNFDIRYGVNMLEYNEDLDISETYSACIPYWTDGTTTVIGDKQESGSATVTGRGECIPLDVSDKFEAQPTKAEVEAMALSLMTRNNVTIPKQNIHVSFVRLQDMSEYEGVSPLLRCSLCDTIRVIFPDYGTSGNFKIVKTTWNVLNDRFDEMELGDLSVTLAEALGISNGLESGSGGGSGYNAIIGEIKAFAGNTPPAGWLKCDGSAISRSTYASLFAAIGTTYGSGDGSTTFNLPDTRGRTLIGVGNGTATGHTNHTLGQKGGNENAIVPYHRHERGGYWRDSGGSSHSGYNYTSNLISDVAYTGYAGTSGNATGANMQPFIAITYIIFAGE